MSELLEILFRAAIAVAAIIVFTRLNGLRTFSKMSSFDFAVTVAFGSVIASAVISIDESIWLGVAALGALIGVQAVVAKARVLSPGFRNAIENTPTLVMRNGEILPETLRETGLTEDDLYGKLREANAFDLTRVLAVIVEPTGDISVLHGTGDGTDTISPVLLEGVRGA